ncbi:MAG: hypothetical protein ACYTBJ_20415 [Planctomycetota bacterium]|jgi:uncharacterized membrane protein
MAAVLWFILYALIVVLVIILLMRLIKFLGVATKEKKLTRMEMGRLADELERARKKEGKNDREETG